MKAVHRLALFLPAMAESEYRELVESIRAHGLKEPVWLYEGQILDGRHRARACEELGVVPHYRDYLGGEPAAFVIDANVLRRQLSAAQRAEIALAFMPELEAEAKARQAHGQTAPGRNASGHVAQSVSADPSYGQRARDIAAAKVGASPKSVQRAKRVQEHAPDLLPAVREGTMTLASAEREASTRQGIAPMSGRVLPTATGRAKLPPGQKRGRKRSPEDVMRAIVGSLEGIRLGLGNVDLSTAATDADEAKRWARECAATITVLKETRKHLIGGIDVQ